MLNKQDSSTFYIALEYTYRLVTRICVLKSKANEKSVSYFHFDNYKISTYLCFGP